jgi:hypothetical protein
MTLGIEFLEILAAVTPALVALVLSLRRATHPSSWFVVLLGSAFLAVLSVGLLLSRLVAQCGEIVTACSDGLVAKPRIAGVFARCYSCHSADESLWLATLLNGWSIPIQAASAIVCVIASVIATVRFVIWTKRLLRSSGEG